MKFILSLIIGMFLSILLILFLGFVLKCEHNNKITSFSFQPEYSTAASSVKEVCEECNQIFDVGRFRGKPSDDSYIDVIEKHIDGGMVTATVSMPYYEKRRKQITCKISEGDIVVYFYAAFKEEYESYLESLSVGDEITFSGKRSDTALYWTECEIVTK